MFGQSLLSAFGSAACTTDTDQLFTTNVQTTSVATYQLNNATTSIPSNTYPGTPANITYAAGKFGNAAEFNGSSSKIDLPNLGIGGASTRTISAWINVNSLSAHQTIFQFGSNASKERFGFDVTTAGKLEISTYGRDITTSSAQITVGSWFNVVVTYNGNAIETATNIQIYVNGSVVAISNIGTTIGNLNTGNANYAIGYDRLNTRQYFNGKIDQVRIFNSALPQAAITALYNETTTTATYPYVDYVGANPNSIAYYKMSDAIDQFGNYNGTATNVNFNTEGKFGFAGAFNGSSSKIALGTNTFNSLTSFSFSCWVNLNNAPTGYEYLFDGWDYQNSSRGIGIRINPSGNIQAQTGFSNSVTTITSSGTITHSVWTHIAVSLTQSNTTISINGNTESPQSNGGFDFHTGTTYNLGAFIYTTSFYEYFLDGKLDQIRIYDSALSAANVTALYNEIECPAVAVTNAFNTVLYTGNGSTQAVTGTGFEPDFTWIKAREASASQQLFDSIRGVSNVISSESTSGQSSLAPNGLTAFNNDGFTVKDIASGGYGVNGSAGGTYSGANAYYVSWNWKAGGTAVSNTDGTITSQVSANVDAGFSIVKWSMSLPLSGTQTIGHGISRPDMIIYKNLDNASQWQVYTQPTGNGGVMFLNLTNSFSAGANKFPSVGNTTFTIGQDFLQYPAVYGGNNIAYCFTSIPGYSKVGSYTGTGATGNVQYVGFEPSFVMVKATSTSEPWFILDNKRDPNNPRDNRLMPDSSAAESNGSVHTMNFNSNNFTLNGTVGNGTNGNGQTYIFLAIA